MLNEPSESASGYPYHLIAGSIVHGYRITTTEDGHITISNSSRQTKGKQLHFRDVVQYWESNSLPSVNVCPKWFTLKAGQEVTFTVSPYLSVFPMNLYVAESTTVYKSFTATSTTFTVEEDVDIGSIGATTTGPSDAGSTYEMDVALYVDGVRYF